MQRNKLTLLALMAAFLLALSGCGSSGGSGGDQTKVADGEPGGSVETAETVGLNVCTNCHAGQTAQWLGGAHGNVTGAYGAPATIEDAIGFPYYDYFSDESCSTCHDPLGDGERLTEELTGNVERPVIGCESCHGGGQLHYGIGPVPYARPDAERCGQCHNSTVDHEKYHPEATAIYEKVVASPHYAGGGYPYVMGNDGTVNPRCSKCHTDEGAKLYKSISGTLGHDDLVTAFEGKEDLVEPNPIQCRTCHDAHDPEKLLFEGTDTASAEFLTCTNCHQVDDSYHGENNKYSWSGYEVGVGEFDGSKIIYDTHFDDPATAEIEGYNIDPANERACRDCHDVHSADLTINEQWAASGHADPAAGAFNSGYATGNASCQECHTSTGARNFFTAMAADEIYDGSSNVISGPAKEVLYCTSCHTDNAGGLFATGPITTHYHAAGSDAYAEIDAVNGSNLCFACHAGKRSGEDIKDGVNAITARVTSHYLPAGGVLYGETGYEFGHIDATLSYDATKHTRIGDADDDLSDWPYGPLSEEQVAAIQGSGNGPCVACHMAEGTDSHLYSAFTDNTELGLPDLCYNCHSNDSASPYFKSKEKLLTETKVGYEAAIAFITGIMADGALNQTGKVLTIGSSGQFQADGADLDPASQADVDLAGALFNYKMFKDEPGGYVHNRYYAKQLLFDSIDYLQNGDITGAITVGDAVAAAWLDGDSATDGIQRK